MPPNDAATEALAHLDAVLAKQPLADPDVLTAALQALARFRDALLAERRRNGSDAVQARLNVANATITAVMTAKYPLGPVPWALLQQSLDSLAAVSTLDRPEAEVP